MLKDIIKKELIVEFVGTFIFALGILGIFYFAHFTWRPVLTGIFLMFVIFLFGEISGGHFNPAVTFGNWVLKRISSLRALAYVIFQFCGAYIAFVTAKILTCYYFERYIDWARIFIPNINFSISYREFLADVFGSIIFGLGIGKVLISKYSHGFASMLTGLSMIMGLFISSLGKGGDLNPALSLALSNLNIGNLFAPVIGIGFGVILSTYLFTKKLSGKS